MRVFLPFFICLAIVVGGVAGTLRNCPRNSSRFAQTELLARLGYGYDPKKVTSFKNGFMNPVITLTDRGRKVQLPYPSNMTLELPCEASEYHHYVQGGHRYSHDRVITSYDQYKSLFNVGGRVGAVLQIIPISGSITGSYTRNSLLTQKSVAVLTYRSYRQAEAWLDPAINSPNASEAPVLDWWTPAFANAVNVLHASDFSHSSYSTLIDKFGTHVVARVTVGGYIEVSANVAYCEYETLKEKEGGLELNRNLLDELKVEIKAHATSSSSSTKSALTQLNIKDRAGGNDTAFLKTGDVDQYIGDVARVKSLAIIPREIRFIEIWKLLQMSDSRRDLLKKAVEAYVGPQPTPVTDVSCGARKPWLSPFAFVFTAIFLCVLY